MDDAAQDVRDRVSRVRGRLPEDVLEPVIAKQEADAAAADARRAQVRTVDRSERVRTYNFPPGLVEILYQSSHKVISSGSLKPNQLIAGLSLKKQPEWQSISVEKLNH